ncbi:MAG: geranylgeranyl reductase, partial [Leptolyngbyaceae cyanobacterium bins.302]|nr:geranylgeranyl reductase [Leptolyngbyaceae cyanobacterium bins.302]
ELPYNWNTANPVLKPEIAHLEYGAIPRGYAWIFPKANHLNIGAGVFKPTGGDARRDRALPEKLRQVILNYLRALHLPPPPDSLPFHAHPLPIWSGKEPLQTADGRILLAGDAAGLINPFFGDGILHALKSGSMAASCIVEGATQHYSDRIHAEFASSFDAARQLATLFYRVPKIGYDYGVKHPKASRIATELLTGELAYNNIVGRTIRHMVGAMLLPGKVRH